MTVHVWVVRSPPGPGVRWLSAREHRRAGRMGSPAASHRYAGARAVLRQVLGQRLGLDPRRVVLEDRPGSAPRVAGHPELRVGLAHADDVVAVALSDDGPVGVDVEVAGARVRPVPAAALSDAKIEAAASLVGPSLAAVGGWVAQEAALKADGVGLAFPLRDVTLRPVGEALDVRLKGRGAWTVTLQVVPPDVVVGVAQPRGASGVSVEVAWHLRPGHRSSQISSR